MQGYLFSIWGKIMDKKISVTIPVYNVEPNFIETAINSVLKQTYKNIEIIVVNDGSTDKNTLNYLKTINNSQIRIINQENKGLGGARNTGIENSTGDYIGFLDAQKRIIEINKQLHSSVYINAIGGQELYNYEDFKKEGIELKFIKMKDIEYKQFDNVFIPNLSMIDVLMFNSKDQIRIMLNNYELI